MFQVRRLKTQLCLSDSLAPRTFVAVCKFMDAQSLYRHAALHPFPSLRLTSLTPPPIGLLSTYNVETLHSVTPSNAHRTFYLCGALLCPQRGQITKTRISPPHPTRAKVQTKIPFLRPLYFKICGRGCDIDWIQTTFLRIPKSLRYSAFSWVVCTFKCLRAV